MIFSPDRLMAVAVQLSERRVAPSEAARIQADLLIEAELRGWPSHGIQRLPRLLARIDRCLADPAARGTLDEERPANEGDLIVLIDPAAGGDRAAALSSYLQKPLASCPLEPDRPIAVPCGGGRRREPRIGIEVIEVPDALWNVLLALEAA